MNRKLAHSLLSDRSGSVLVMFAFALIPIALLIGLVLDYGKSSWLQAKVQVAADEAALGIIAQATNYIIAHNDYPQQTTVNTYIQAAVRQIYAQTGVQLTSAQYPVYCTPTNGTCAGTFKGQTVTLSAGQALVNVPITQPRLFWNSSSAASVPISASTIAGSKAAPMTVNLQFQYAKGLWFKIVSLWATPNGQSSPVKLASWTYQATNTGTANPSSAPPYFTTYASETGVGVVIPSYTSSASVDSSGNINLSGFQNPYLTMWVQYGYCAPGTTQRGGYDVSAAQSFLPSGQSYADYYTRWYGASTGAPDTIIKCDGTPSTNASDYSLIETTNTGQNSDYFYINGQEQAASTPLTLSTIFPCSTSGANKPRTSYQSWEDWSNAANTNRDFYFAVTVTCASTIASGVPTLQR